MYERRKDEDRRREKDRGKGAHEGIRDTTCEAVVNVCSPIVAAASLFTILLVRGCSKSLIVCADDVIAVVSSGVRPEGDGEDVDLTAQRRRESTWHGRKTRRRPPPFAVQTHRCFFTWHLPRHVVATLVVATSSASL